jgi:hypothetical protein
MPQFAPLESFLDDSLTLPIQGKEYVIKSPDSEVGLWVIKMREIVRATARGVQLDDADVEFMNSYSELNDEAALQHRILGDAFDQMLADKVPWEYVKVATGTAMAWIAEDRAAAERFWANAAPKAPAGLKAPQDRRPAKKAASPRQRSSAKRTASPTRKASAATPGTTS